MEWGEFAGVPNNLLPEDLSDFVSGDCFLLWPDPGIWCRATGSKMDPAEVVLVVIVPITIATMLLLTQTAKLIFPKPWIWIAVHAEHLPDWDYLIRPDQTLQCTLCFTLLLHMWTLRNREVKQLAQGHRVHSKVCPLPTPSALTHHSLLFPLGTRGTEVS